jgi:hypothetical protein
MHIHIAQFWHLTAIALAICATISQSSGEEQRKKISGFVGNQPKAIEVAAFPEQIDGVKASGLFQEISHQPLNELPLCRNVRNVRRSDRCAFVQAHCKEGKVGFVNYLSIYYCGPGLIASVAAVAWLLTLSAIINISASKFLCGNLSTISIILGMSQSMVSQSFS